MLTRPTAGAEFIEPALERELAKADLTPPDRALCLELTRGVVRWRRTLDWLIARKTEGRAQNQTILVLLEMGLYQLFWLSRIPDHAAVHETVELGKRLGFGPRAGFLNAILRGFLREREQTAALLSELKVSQPDLGYSHPEWIFQRWLHRFGLENTIRLLEWNNTPPPTFARLNTLKATAAELAAAWQAEGVQFKQCAWDWTGEDMVFELESHPSLAGLGSFQRGLFYIQDPSTLLAPQTLAPQPGETVLDFCAAPGGKTAFMAQLMDNRGRLVAQDRDAEHLQRVRENCDRLGVQCVEAGAADLMFDRILVDAPCSNTGVLRRRVELRWRIQPSEIDRLRQAQLELLQTAAARLKPGGTLVYSTCSLEPEENEEVVKAFLAANPQFKLESERTLVPFTAGVDGGYVARLAR